MMIKWWLVAIFNMGSREFLDTFRPPQMHLFMDQCAAVSSRSKYIHTADTTPSPLIVFTATNPSLQQMTGFPTEPVRGFGSVA